MFKFVVKSFFFFFDNTRCFKEGLKMDQPYKSLEISNIEAQI